MCVSFCFRFSDRQLHHSKQFQTKSPGVSAAHSLIHHDTFKRSQRKSQGLFSYKAFDTTYSIGIGLSTKLPTSLSLQPSIFPSSGLPILSGAINTTINTRSFHVSSHVLKEESKVEQTVKALKDTAEEAKKSKVIPSVPEETTLVPAKKTLSQRAIGVVKHYYHGFRLLFIDFRISCKLIWQLLNGATLSRREYKQVGVIGSFVLVLYFVLYLIYIECMNECLSLCTINNMSLYSVIKQV